MPISNTACVTGLVDPVQRPGRSAYEELTAIDQHQTPGAGKLSPLCLSNRLAEQLLGRLPGPSRGTTPNLPRPYDNVRCACRVTAQQSGLSPSPSVGPSIPASHDGSILPG